MRMRDELAIRYNEVKAQVDKIDLNNTNLDASALNALTDKMIKIKADMKQYESDPNNREMFRFDAQGNLEITNKDGAMDDHLFTGGTNMGNFKEITPLGANGNQFTGNGGLQFLNSANIDQAYQNKENLDFGKYIKGALTGDWASAGSERGVYAALSTSTGGVIIPDVLSAQILKKIMATSLIYQSGVPVVNMTSNNLSIAKVKNNPTGAFKAELAEATPSDAEFEAVQLKSKTLYALCKVSLEMLHSAANLTEVLQTAMADAIASAIDKACIYGTDVSGIKGIAGTAGVNQITSTATTYADFVNAVGMIRMANGNPTTMGINANTDTKLNLLTDSTGQPLNAPNAVNGLTRVVSNNLRNNLGTAKNESESLVYDPNAIVLGQQVGLRFEVSREHGMTDGSVFLRIYAMLDMAVIRPDHISYISGLK